MPRAPKVCSAIGCTHDALLGKSKCDNHYVPFANSPRRPDRADTAARRELRRDVFKAARGLCQIRLPGMCTFRAEILDRIDNAKGYERHNCQAACDACHRVKTSQEGHEARGNATSISDFRRSALGE